MSSLRCTSTALVLTVALIAATPLPVFAEDKWPAVFDAQPIAVNDDDDQLLKLFKERHNAAVRELQYDCQQFKEGATTFVVLFSVGLRVLNSELEIGNSDAARRIEIYEQQVELAKTFEGIQQNLHRSGVATAAEMENAKYWRLDAEIQLMRAQRQEQ